MKNNNLMSNFKINLNPYNKGITLVALVITIVILLILAGISISALTNTGIFQKAQDAKGKSENAEKQQSELLDSYEKELYKYTSEELTTANANVVLSKTENVELHDANGYKIVVPAGFKVVVNDDTNNAMTVDKGIVIEDATSSATAGSQFVWIPVGTITKADGTTVEINLNRYTFDSDGNKTSKNDSAIAMGSYNYQELATGKGNTVAKSITNFKNSVTTNEGYYIGRYEARTTTKRTAAGNTLTQITEKGTDYVYNYVTQIQAASQAQKMYDNTHPYTSDLMNSYAWDTATLFLQSCGTNNKYSRQTRVSSSPATTGTNNQTTKDIQCNVYDMASNVFEWTTEASSFSGRPCSLRGGFYDFAYGYTSYRDCISTSYSNNDIGFRPLLYVNV